MGALSHIDGGGLNADYSDLESEMDGLSAIVALLGVGWEDGEI
jgi:hypothetical protein